MLIGSIAGQIHAVEPAMKRIVQREGSDGLGSFADIATPAGKLWMNADGYGTNYPVLWRQFTPKLIYFQTVWVYVDGIQTVTDEGGERITKTPSIHIIDPIAVDNWGEENGRKVWVKVRHKVMENDNTPEGDQKVVEKRTVYTLDGWKRYRKIKGADGKEAWADDTDGNEPAQGTYAFYETSDRTKRILPIFQVRMPFDMYLGYMLARKSVVLLNKESERDHLVRYGSLVTRVDESSPMVYDEHKTQQREGEFTQNFEAGSKLYFAAPPMQPAIENREIIREKRENFFRTAYQQFNDQAAQATATQIRQSSRAGIESLLSLISATLDEAETQALFLLEQITFPDKPNLWGQAYAERSTDFLAADEDARDAMLREMYFGPSPLPASPEMLLNIAAHLYERRGFELTEEQRTVLQSHVDAFVQKRDGVGPRVAESRQRLSELAGTLLGQPVN